jgi:hypothetical protein
MNLFVALVGAFVAMVATWIGLTFLFSLPVMWLWNWLMPTLFGLTTLTWPQAWGLSLLSAFLFKSSNTTKVTNVKQQ